MRIAYRWLLDYVKTALPVNDLADRFVYTSSEVEGIENWAERFANVVIGSVLEVAPHPNADRLRVATVDVGEKKPRQIVCGAPNLAAGQTVAVALPGAVLPSGVQIGETTIRGVASAGMICAAAELGIGAESAGTMELTTQDPLPFASATRSQYSVVSLTPGTPAGEAFLLNDTVLDLETTPNRPDLTSYLGLAREVATFEKHRLIEPMFAVLDPNTSRLPAPAATIEDGKLCSRYTAVAVGDITITESPRWLQSRLLLAGVRPLNSIVDVLNYVTLELGQPLHAFDYQALPAPTVGKPLLSVRSAERGERLLALDGSTRILHTEDTVIADAKGRAVALAGIIGGSSTAVQPGTSTVIIEAATFVGPRIRRSARRHGLRTEASSRFEKGIDSELTVKALKRVLYLLQQLNPALTVSPITDVNGSRHRERPRIHLTFDRVQQLLGVHISASETRSILQNLGFQITSLTKSSFEVVPPTWRADVTIPEDVVEELVRIWGFDRIPSTIPSGAVKAPVPNALFDRKGTIRRQLASFGLHECVHITLTSREALKRAGVSLAKAINIPLPLSAEGEYLLPTHLIALLQTAGSANQRETEAGTFEIGRIFFAPHHEREVLTILWRSSGSSDSLYRTAKTQLIQLARALNLVDSVQFTVAVPLAPGEGVGKGAAPVERYTSILEPGSTCNVQIGEASVGQLGLIRSTVSDGFKIRSGRALVAAEIDTALLLGCPHAPVRYTPPTPFPAVYRDITVTLPEPHQIAALTEAITRVSPPEAQVQRQWTIGDIYVGKPYQAGTRAVTIHFTYTADRTLTDAEVDTDQKALTAALQATLPVTTV